MFVLSFLNVSSSSFPAREVLHLIPYYSQTPAPLSPCKPACDSFVPRNYCFGSLILERSSVALNHRFIILIHLNIFLKPILIHILTVNSGANTLMTHFRTCIRSVRPASMLTRPSWPTHAASFIFVLGFPPHQSIHRLREAVQIAQMHRYYPAPRVPHTIVSLFVWTLSIPCHHVYCSVRYPERLYL